MENTLTKITTVKDKRLSVLTKNWAVAELKVSYKPKQRTCVIVNTESASYQVLRQMWDDSLINIQEQFCVLFLTNHLEVIGFRVINTGKSTSATVDFNFIITCALLCQAKRVILAHNHPSGSTQPSKADIDLTSALKYKLQQFEVEVCDHIIMVDKSFLSFVGAGIKF